jgi:hypothetical protein
MNSRPMKYRKATTNDVPMNPGLFTGVVLHESSITYYIQPSASWDLVDSWLEQKYSGPSWRWRSFDGNGQAHYLVSVIRC